MRAYEVDKTLVPLTVYENYFRALATKGLAPRDQLKVSLDVLESVSLAEKIECQMYTDGNFELQATHGFLSTAHPSFLVNKDGTRGATRYPMDMSTELNRATIRNSAKRQIVALADALPMYSLNDLPFIARILANAKAGTGRASAKSLYTEFKARHKLDAKQMEWLLKLARS